MTMFGTVFAVSFGAALGALLRHALSAALNPSLSHLLLGTLVSNLIAAFIVGAALAYFAGAPGLSPAWRLFIVTGFAGGLSTFSTFSAELLNLLREARLGAACGMLIGHVGGSLAMTALGMALATALRRS